jgi:diguanylate cyclase (GGDEF)-like protein
MSPTSDLPYPIGETLRLEINSVERAERMSSRSLVTIAVGAGTAGPAYAAVGGGDDWLLVLFLLIALAGVILAFRLRAATDRLWKQEAELVVSRGQVSDLEKALEHRDEILEREIFSRTLTLESDKQRLERERAELESSHSRLKSLVDIDPVTGLATRDGFRGLVDSELRRSLREGRPVSVIAFGIDRFRELNHSRGHDAGDQALNALGEIVNTVFRRAGDASGRLGGDRIGVIVPGANREAAMRLAERVRAETWRLAIPHDASPGMDRVTASAGCMTVPPRTRTEADTVLGAAEAALGIAQREGGNRAASDLPPRRGKPSLRPVSGSAESGD